VVIGGKVLTGIGPASELGHMVIRAGGRQCGCGRKGCFETYASATGLIRTAEEAANARPESLLAKMAAEHTRLDGRMIFEAVDAGDPAAIEVEERYLDDLAEGLANIIAVFFPDVIALSGGIANRGEKLLEPLREKVSAIAYGEQYATRHTRIVNCTLGYDAGIIGAAMYAAE
jgi:glucokinase